MTIDYSMVYDKLSQEVARTVSVKKSFIWSHEFIENNEIHLRMFIPDKHITIDFDEVRDKIKYMIEDLNTKFVRTKCKGTIKITIQERNYICYEGYVPIPETDEKTYIEKMENLIRSLKGNGFIEN